MLGILLDTHVLIWLLSHAPMDADTLSAIAKTF